MPHFKWNTPRLPLLLRLRDKLLGDHPKSNRTMIRNL